MVFDTENIKQERDPIKEDCDLIKDLFWLRIKDNENEKKDNNNNENENLGEIDEKEMRNYFLQMEYEYLVNSGLMKLGEKNSLGFGMLNDRR